MRSMALSVVVCRQTRTAGQPGSVKLLISDTTELDFGRHRKVTGLGPTGNGGGLGFFLHSSLMIDVAANQIDGLAGQRVFYRKARPKTKPHKNSRRRCSDRESVIWGELIDDIGPPTNGMKWIHVCDRGADDFEVFCRALRQECGFVIRAARLNRKVFDDAGKKLPLRQFLDRLPTRGISQITVRPGHNVPGRTAIVELRFGQVLVPVPSVKSPWIPEYAPRDPLLLWIVELREPSPPKGVTPLRWVLYSSEVVNTVADAQTRLRQLRSATTVSVVGCGTALRRWHYTAASFVTRPPASLTN